MSMFYLAGRGFLHPAVHASIPLEAVELTDAEYSSLLAAQSGGMVIAEGDDGRPCAVAPVVTAEDAAARIRRQRDRLLTASDWVVTKATETGTPVPADWSAYRQALRDITAHPEFPLGVIGWPVAPA